MSDFIQIMRERGFYHQSSDLEGLRAKLSQGIQSAYIGYDPTAQSLHVGNLMGVMLLKWFQQCGHKPITLMGGGTVMAGDPSGKDETRKLMNAQQIDANIGSIQPVFGKFLDYHDGPNGAVMVNNADWLLSLNYISFLREIGPHFSINRMLAMDSVKLRIEREQSLSFLEFNYMIMQGYDFVELHKRFGTAIQMGGSDQWGNIISGVELGRRMKGLELFAFTTPLLQTSSGAKMGKSAQGAVWLNADMCSPYDYYQYWRNTEDADVIRWMKIYTMLPMNEVNRYAQLQGQEINEAKKTLAFEATKLCHGEQAALEAAETARKTFEEGGVGGAIPQHEFDVKGDTTIANTLADLGLIKSRGEARRLMEQGGVRVNDVVVKEGAATFESHTPPYKIHVGKKNVYLLTPKP